MKSKITILIIAGFLVLGSIAIADEANNNNQMEPEDIKIAIVDYWAAEREVMDIRIEGLTYREVKEEAEERGYELVVEWGTMEFFIDDVLEEISDLTDENITEEVREILIEIEGIEEVTDFEDMEELLEMEGIKDITDEVIEWFTEDEEE